MSQIAAELNNRAVYLLLEGKREEAEILLGKAMSLLNNNNNTKDEPSQLESSSTSMDATVKQPQQQQQQQPQQGDALMRRASAPAVCTTSAPASPSCDTEEPPSRSSQTNKSRRTSDSSSDRSCCSTAAVCRGSFDDADDADCDDDDVDMEDLDFDLDYEDCDDYDTMETMAVQSVELPGEEDVHTVLPLYNRALLLFPAAEQPEIVAAIMYNVGLVHHMQTCCEDSNSTKEKQEILVKACKFYDFAIQILQQQKHNRSQDVEELLVLALFYNLGHAYAQLFVLDKAQGYLDFCRQILQDTMSESSCGTVTTSLHDEDHSFFYLHVTLLSQQHNGQLLPLAPAA